MNEIKEGDTVWAVPNSMLGERLLVKVRRIYKSSINNSDYLVERYSDPRNHWYTTQKKLKPLTPEEKLELATFGKILEVD